MGNTKPIILAGVAITALVTGVSLYRFNRTSKQLVVNPTTNIHSLDFKELKIRLDLNFKNPTGNTLTIKKPFIQLIHKGENLGSSKIADVTVEIPSHGQEDIKGIMISIPLVNLPGPLQDLTKLITGKVDQLKIQVKTVTPVITQVGELSITSTDDTVLKRLWK